ncbi:MAG: hypothetical protein HOD34_04015 [Candidatus Peribacter sp.]|nr:hypothetical protein [Candidatus Peribacter sp.]
MEKLNHHQWHIFWVTCAVVAFAIVCRLWVLLPLYADSSVRASSQTLILATATREGWLLSGITIDDITDDHIRVLYRSYLRGEDPMSCHNISFTTGKSTSCDDF